MLKYWIVLLTAVFLTGCLEFDNTSSDSGTASETEVASEDEQPGPVGADQEEWDSIRWHTAQGPSGAGARQVMTLDAQIASDGRTIRFGWDRYPWGNSNGLGHFFVWDGSRWVGGKFEWITPPGQAVKTLTNIRNGYNRLSAPAPGTRVAFAWTNAQATERSNLVVTTWR